MAKYSRRGKQAQQPTKNDVGIQVGDQVTYRQQGETFTVRITNASFSNPAKKIIHSGTPLARALLGQAIGDKIEAHLPVGKVQLEILDVVPGPRPQGPERSQQQTHDRRQKPTGRRKTVLPDPRVASRSQLRRHLMRIIAAEAPVLVSRVYRLYCRAAHTNLSEEQYKAFFNPALQSLYTDGKVLFLNEHKSRDLLLWVVRPVNTPAVKVRKRGRRTFAEIPPREIAAVMKNANRQAGPKTKRALYEQVLRHYNLLHQADQIALRLDQIYEDYVK